MRWECAAISICAALLGCEPEPDDVIVLGGQLVQEDGTPCRSCEVEAARQDDPRSTDPSDWTFSPWSTATTDIDGRYFLRFHQRDLRFAVQYGMGYFAGDRTYELTLPAEAGARSAVRFSLSGGDNALPALRPWTAALTVTSDVSSHQFTWRRPPSVGDLEIPSAQVVIASHGKTVWLAPGDGQVSVRADLLEDFADPGASVRAKTSGSHGWYPLTAQPARLSFDLVWESPQISLSTPMTQPLSRGAPCDLGSKPAQPCPLTDGSLEPVQLGSGTSEIIVRLDSPRLLERAVLRGMRLQSTFQRALQVDGSPDGITWTQLASTALDADSEVTDVPLQSPAPASFVRFRGVEGPEKRAVAFTRLAEVSLFEQ